MKDRKGRNGGRGSKDRVGILLPPPAYPLAGLGAAFGLHVLVPLAEVPDAVRWAGAVLALLAVALAVWAVVTLARHRTPVDPYRPTTAIVDEGPYRWSRNPIYVGFVVGMLGIGLALGWLWSVACAPLVFVALHLLVVRREEAYLAGKFGSAYTDYRRRVRRWV